MRAYLVTRMTHKHRAQLALWILGLGAALLAPLLLRWAGVATQIDNELEALGFDAERVLLIDQLLLTFLGCILASLFTQRRSSSWMGGVISFALEYLVPFVQRAQQPGLGPDGQPQVLIPGALNAVAITMFALGVIFAGAGAVLGQSCGSVLIKPLVALCRRSLARIRHLPLAGKAPSVATSLCMLLLGCIVVSALVFSAIGTGSLLTYGPLTNLYRSAPHNGRSRGPQLKQGTLRHGTFISPALGGSERSYWIYLPPSYLTAEAQHYPTFYLLHGSPGEPYDWFGAAHAATTADALIAAHKMRETILIGVDGNGPVYRFSEWANSFDGRQHMEDSLVKDLVPFIDSHYRTLRDTADRAIGGLSMGGYGAVNIALHHPDVFREVMSVGGYFQAEGPVFGLSTSSASYRQFNSPSLLLQTVSGKKAADLLKWVIGVGTTDGHYYSEGMGLYQQLLTLGTHAWLLTGIGGHSWPLWAKQFGEALPLLEPLHSSSH